MTLPEQEGRLQNPAELDPQGCCFGVTCEQDTGRSAATTQQQVPRSQQKRWALKKHFRNASTSFGSCDGLDLDHAAVENVLCTGITVRNALQPEVRAAQRTVGRELPNATDLHIARCRRRGLNIIKDAAHPDMDCSLPQNSQKCSIHMPSHWKQLNSASRRVLLIS
ncbi:hypothetical protein OJAV_G00166670 [Oryzias javanicus]|uniref:Uncharacterized protein n=1 Tax=Oryzias javanicus TaxID=123683 RepID=A0A3S2U271_ORYJA|nr:hypothetical protein OJAV_G00166670 [Oryzias javanicus]